MTEVADRTRDPSGNPDEAVARIVGAQTLERGLDLLERAARDPMSILDLIRQSGINRGVVYRLVSVLTARNYLSMTSDGRLCGGSTLLQLGQAASASTDIVTVTQPHLEALAQRTGLSAFLARRDGDHSVHLSRVAGTERIAVTSQPGTRRLLPETGLGKTLMSDDDRANCERLCDRVDERYRQADLYDQLATVRTKGVLNQIGPAPDFINSVCAPIRDAAGRIVGAINIAAPAHYLDAETMALYTPLVTETARAVSRALGAVDRTTAAG
ncbi:IclR family transcriptional regulator [Sphingomonas ginsenosidivorax]|uniref:IclR family transcriptional regulator n=1 Tax=Sphingomonas ginsenosidivorax TaxID=862135 RepID=A0A5C6UBS1_9SPHN|nr:IclR family transcriptional regulator [Sphingomonas ginsenosidivorax]TXC69661.1 IclR family transcriptional regulator [Sphingomonas ginsenosidivorax]